jgi:hypothetical protein
VRSDQLVDLLNRIEPLGPRVWFRTGFTWRDVDHHDVAVLRELVDQGLA